MKLIIDPAGGIAGDMFSAALISAGADFESLRAVMSKAAVKLGSAQISLDKTPDDAYQLKIALASKRDHLGGKEAGEILTELFSEFGIKKQYQDFGLKILDILLKAEIRAHADLNIKVKTNHHHRHEHDAFLHEAQDIVIDIMGAVMGMQVLQVEPGGRLLSPVSVGGGLVKFSHGTLPVPAPAAEIIMEQYRIQWQKGPLELELATPTGVAILAALGARESNPAALKDRRIAASGTARGTKILDIPPLRIYLTG